MSEPMYSDADLSITTTVVPITVSNLAKGSHWEEDGSCWEAVLDHGAAKGWRWRPNNWKAFAKEGPEGEMTGHSPYVGTP